MATTNEHENNAKANDSNLQKGTQAGIQSKPDSPRVKTVTPDNDNGDPGAPVQKDSSNKEKGPAGENL
ncbi:MAG: hypothetical protein ACHQF4_01465 [Sphingobacteriales bacterium]